MTDYLHVLFRWIDHNRGLVLGLLAAGLLSAYLMGCQATTPSLIDPQRKVNAQQLHAESLHLHASLEQQQARLQAEVLSFNATVHQFNEQLEAAVADLEHQQLQRQAMVETLGGLVVDLVVGRFDPMAAVTAGLGLFSMAAAVGLGFDNLRKNKVIDQLKHTTHS